MSQDFINPYPDYDVLEKWDSPSWDDITREVIARRLNEVPPRRFLEREEYADARGRLRTASSRSPTAKPPVPIAPWIDEKLFVGPQGRLPL